MLQQHFNCLKIIINGSIQSEALVFEQQILCWMIFPSSWNFLVIKRNRKNWKRWIALQMRSDDGLVISVYREQLCIRIKSYPTWTLVHIQFIHTVIFMDNGRDRFETDINQKTGRKLSVHFELYEGAWISADSSGIWKTDRSKINVICFFQN